MSKKESIKCSFCSFELKDVELLIQSEYDEAAICGDCLKYGNELLEEADETEEVDAVTKVDGPQSPEAIKEFLDQYVVGQEHAKKVMSVAMFNHYTRINNPKEDGVEIDKSNILLAGPSGSGKTLIAKSLAKFIGVPIAITDATLLTEAGYVGDDVESILTRLLEEADNNVELCERGIVFIDEIDKKSKRVTASTKDASGEGVQQALLKIIEGTKVRVPVNGSKKSAGTATVEIDTSNILFIVAGAFVGLEKKIKGNTSVGFGAEVNSNNNKTLKDVEPSHLIEFGMIPELIGRLPIIVALDELTTSDLVSILQEPKNAITKQFNKLFSLNDLDLEFTDDALNAIAKKAIENKTGARGLRNIIERALLDTQFEIESLKQEGVTKVVVDRDLIEGVGLAKLIKTESKKEM